MNETESDRFYLCSAGRFSPSPGGSSCPACALGTSSRRGSGDCPHCNTQSVGVRGGQPDPPSCPRCASIDGTPVPGIEYVYADRRSRATRNSNGNGVVVGTGDSCRFCNPGAGHMPRRPGAVGPLHENMCIALSDAVVAVPSQILHEAVRAVGSG